MNAAVLLAEVERAGLTVEAGDGCLLVAPRNRLSPELRARLAAAKPQLLELLRRDPCGECGSRTWRVALDGVCHDCLVGLTQLRRGGAAV